MLQNFQVTIVILDLSSFENIGAMSASANFISWNLHTTTGWENSTIWQHFGIFNGK